MAPIGLILIFLSNVITWHHILYF